MKRLLDRDTRERQPQALSPVATLPAVADGCVGRVRNVRIALQRSE
jgi:hypothetical protein